jgi:hypothetical protein
VQETATVPDADLPRQQAVVDAFVRCLVTIANGNGPPGERPSPQHHGNGRLWTVLAPEGIDNGSTPQPDGSISQKYPWWMVGTTGERG